MRAVYFIPMLKNLLLACLCSLLLPITLLAQAPEITRSKPFDEPDDGASRLLLMKNGNTLFFHFTAKKGVDVVVYDKKHHASSTVNSRIRSWKAKKTKNASLAGLYEMNGEGVVFIKQAIHRKTCLFRLIFDGKTGKLVKEEMISDLPDSQVRKDPNSEYYAVAGFSSLERGSNEMIKVTHYSPDHKEINEASYESPNGGFKYMEFKGMYVHQDQFVFIATFAHNTKTSGKDSRILISRIAKGEKAFEHKLLDYTDDYKEPMVALKYNSANKNLYLLAAINAKSAGRPYTMYTTSENLVLQMSVIDPFALAVSKKYFVDHPLLSDYAKEHLKYKKPYYGVIQDFRINEDNSITLMYEELEAKTEYYTSTTYINGRPSTSNRTSYSTRFGDIGIVRLDDEGKETPGSYAIAKSQHTGSLLRPYFIYRRPQTDWNFRRVFFKTGTYNEGFLSYDYMFVNNVGYSIFNDVPVNVSDSTENYRRKKTMVAVSAVNTVIAYCDGDKVKKTFLFGDPGRKDEARFSLLEMNAYSDDNKSLATLMIERKGNDKKAYIVWITF